MRKHIKLKNQLINLVCLKVKNLKMSSIKLSLNRIKVLKSNLIILKFWNSLANYKRVLNNRLLFSKNPNQELKTFTSKITPRKMFRSRSLIFINGKFKLNQMIVLKATKVKNDYNIL